MLAAVVVAGVPLAPVVVVAVVAVWSGALVRPNKENIAADGGAMPLIAIFNSLTRGSAKYVQQSRCQQDTAVFPRESDAERGPVVPIGNNCREISADPGRAGTVSIPGRWLDRKPPRSLTFLRTVATPLCGSRWLTRGTRVARRFSVPAGASSG